jgi:adenylate cyclase
MFVRLPTVRAKLTALVALSVVVMLVALPVLSWVLHKQLVDEADDRVTDAEKAFQTELDDDLADLTLAARVLAADHATLGAVERHNSTRARQLAHVFLDVYPDIDVLLFESNGHVLAQVGCDHPPEKVDEIPEIAEVLQGKELHAVVAHGCESPTSNAPPAYVIGLTLGAAGGVAACLPIDDSYLKNASAKLGLELAFAAVATVTPGGSGGAPVTMGQTPEFPDAGRKVSSQASTMVDTSSRTWAVARFAPRQLVGRMGQVGILAALDVTDIRMIVRRNLLYALAFLAVAAAISVAFGSRLASVMSNALNSVSVALHKVERLEYVHVAPVNTGDELETLAKGFNHMVDGLKERDNLRTTFGKYMTQSVMDHLLAGKVALGGETLQVTVLFTDIRSFTTISEKMDPQSLVALLNEYFTAMVGIVMQEGGVVDKYIGDAIMAVFGAPVPKPEDTVNAVRAAVRMRQELEHLNVRLEARGIPRLRTGIGLHTGEVVAGNIGSEKRMEYTVIGDTVNLASRLESSTKELGVNILISEDTYALTKHTIVTKPVREITVKGRKQPVMTYEVLGLQGEAALSATDAEA